MSDDFGDLISGTWNAAKGFVASLETLESFKKRVDDLLDDLEGSAADPAKISRGTLQAAYFGTGFAEAKDLYGVYHPVHNKLKELSKTFADQIEAMRLLTGIAKDDYENVDHEENARLWAIKDRMDQYYRSVTKGQDGRTADTGRTDEGDGGDI